MNRGTLECRPARDLSQTNCSLYSSNAGPPGPTRPGPLVRKISASQNLAVILRSRHVFRRQLPRVAFTFGSTAPGLVAPAMSFRRKGAPRATRRPSSSIEGPRALHEGFELLAMSKLASLTKRAVERWPGRSRVPLIGAPRLYCR